MLPIKSIKNTRTRRDKGFTLVEVVIALSILSIGLLAIASMQILAIHVNSTANNMTEGTTWAQDKLEELLALPFTDSDLVDSNATVGTGTPYTEPNPPNGYVITWNVDDDNPVANVKRLTVTASWHGGTKTSRLICSKCRL